MNVEDTLNERRKTHGDFSLNASISQHLKAALEQHAAWGMLEPTQREALHMICHKMSRILAGNPNEPDHWRDIAGYATLVEKDIHRERLPQEQD